MEIILVVLFLLAFILNIFGVPVYSFITNKKTTHKRILETFLVLIISIIVNHSVMTMLKSGIYVAEMFMDLEYSVAHNLYYYTTLITPVIVFILWIIYFILLGNNTQQDK